MGTRRGAGSERRAVAEMGAGSGRMEERRRSARNRTRNVDTMWETGNTWVEREKKRIQERVDSVAANPDNLGNSKEAGGEVPGTQGLSKNCTNR